MSKPSAGRTKTLSASLTKSEKESVKQQAKAVGMKMSQWLRSKLFTVDEVTPRKKEHKTVDTKSVDVQSESPAATPPATEAPVSISPGVPASIRLRSLHSDERADAFSWAKASAIYRTWLDGHGYGGKDLDVGTGNVFNAAGEKIGTVSYNGRCWANDGSEIKPEAASNPFLSVTIGPFALKAIKAYARDIPAEIKKHLPAEAKRTAIKPMVRRDIWDAWVLSEDFAGVIDAADRRVMELQPEDPDKQSLKGQGELEAASNTSGELIGLLDDALDRKNPSKPTEPAPVIAPAVAEASAKAWRDAKDRALAMVTKAAFLLDIPFVRISENSAGVGVIAPFGFSETKENTWNDDLLKALPPDLRSKAYVGVSMDPKDDEDKEVQRPEADPDLILKPDHSNGTYSAIVNGNRVRFYVSQKGEGSEQVFVLRDVSEPAGSNDVGEFATLLEAGDKILEIQSGFMKPGKAKKEKAAPEKKDTVTRGGVVFTKLPSDYDKVKKYSAFDGEFIVETLLKTSRGAQVADGFTIFRKSNERMSKLTPQTLEGVAEVIQSAMKPDPAGDARLKKNLEEIEAAKPAPIPLDLDVVRMFAMQRARNEKKVGNTAEAAEESIIKLVPGMEMPYAMPALTDAATIVKIAKDAVEYVYDLGRTEHLSRSQLEAMRKGMRVELEGSKTGKISKLTYMGVETVPYLVEVELERKVDGVVKPTTFRKNFSIKDVTKILEDDAAPAVDSDPDRETKIREGLAKDDAEFWALPVFKRVNGWEIVKAGMNNLAPTYWIRDPATRKKFPSGTLPDAIKFASKAPPVEPAPVVEVALVGLDSSLYGVRPKFGVAGGPDEVFLTQEGLEKAFSIGAKVKRGPSEALLALEGQHESDRGWITKRFGSKGELTDLGKISSVHWSHLGPYGLKYIEPFQNDSGDGYKLTDLGLDAVKAGHEEQDRLLARAQAHVAASQPAPIVEAPRIIGCQDCGTNHPMLSGRVSIKPAGILNRWNLFQAKQDGPDLTCKVRGVGIVKAKAAARAKYPGIASFVDEMPASMQPPPVVDTRPAYRAPEVRSTAQAKKPQPLVLETSRGTPFVPPWTPGQEVPPEDPRTSSELIKQALKDAGFKKSRVKKGSGTAGSWVDVHIPVDPKKHPVKTIEVLGEAFPRTDHFSPEMKYRSRLKDLSETLADKASGREWTGDYGNQITLFLDDVEGEPSMDLDKLEAFTNAYEPAFTGTRVEAVKEAVKAFENIEPIKQKMKDRLAGALAYMSLVAFEPDLGEGWRFIRDSTEEAINALDVTGAYRSSGPVITVKWIVGYGMYTDRTVHSFKSRTTNRIDQRTAGVVAGMVRKIVDELNNFLPPETKDKFGNPIRRQARSSSSVVDSKHEAYQEFDMSAGVNVTETREMVRIEARINYLDLVEYCEEKMSKGAL